MGNPARGGMAKIVVGASGGAIFGGAFGAFVVGLPGVVWPIVAMVIGLALGGYVGALIGGLFGTDVEEEPDFRDDIDAGRKVA